MNNKTKIIDQKVWNDLKFSTLTNIKDLTKSAKILLDANMEENKEFLGWHPWVAGGLYTFAIEEYGKLLYLLSCKPSEGKVEINYDGQFRNHTKKFKRALDELPPKCKNLHSGSFTTSGFTSSGYNTDTLADFEVRKGIFYVDLDENDKLKIFPRVDARVLLKAISKFGDIIKNIQLDVNNKSSI